MTLHISSNVANTTNSTTSVITTGVAPRIGNGAVLAAPVILDHDIETVVIPSAKRPAANPLARLLKKARSIA